MIERLEEFIKNQCISVRSFEQTISASDGMIRRAINNKTDIQSKWLSKIADNYPQLNLNWLITGKGSMIISTQNKDSNELPIAHHTDSKEGKPLIPINAMAGAFTEDQQIMEYECERLS